MASHVVIFGSAADPLTRKSARDLDVAYTGSRATAAALVQEWARENSATGLPVDWHETRPHWDGGGVPIPTPCGVTQPAHVLTPDTHIKWVPVHSLAAHVRAYAGPGLSKRLPESTRLTVIPAPGQNAADLDWTAYVEGLTALRNAIAKTPSPDDTRKVLTLYYGHMLGRLLTEDPKPTPEALEILRNGSPVAACGAVILVLRRGRVCLQYDSRARVEGLLFGDGPDRRHVVGEPQLGHASRPGGSGARGAATSAVCAECAAVHGEEVGQVDPDTGLYTCIRGHTF